MKKKAEKTTRKVALRREIVAMLETPELRRVAGGSEWTEWSPECLVIDPNR